jgi:hypothetical protein
MLVGLFHFHNPNADYVKFAGIDVMTPERQREIAEVTAALARFQPTRIAVERPVEERDTLNARYASYRHGGFELTANEVYQLGFRLAGRMGHDSIYPVDYQRGFAMDSVMQYAAEHDPQAMAGFQQYIGRVQTLLDSMQQHATIAANLRLFSEPANVAVGNEAYVVLATVGAGDGYVGARAVAGWYERNLGIFANLSRVATPGQRVVLLIGSGHVPIIRQLVIEHPGMTLVEAIDYLP